MAWPHRVWVGTAAKGIYVADPFTGTGAQPVWATANGGLASTLVRSFCLDRHAIPNDTRMYCIADGVLYKRTIGDWVELLTSAEARTVAACADGEVLNQVVVDPMTGFVYASLKRPDYGKGTLGLIRSVDYGTTWTNRSFGYFTALYATEGLFDVYDGLVAMGYVRSPLTHRMAFYDEGTGASNDFNIDGLSAPNVPVRMHPLLAKKWYAGRFEYSDYFDLVICQTTPVNAPILPPIYHIDLNPEDETGPYRQGGIWFDPDDSDHVLTLSKATATVCNETADGFATTPSQNAIVSQAYIGEIAEASQNGFWVYGYFGTGGVGQACAPIHVSTDGYNVSNRSGANWDVSPYTDSIPEAHGGVVHWGVWAVFDTPTEGPTPPPGGTITPPGGSPITLGGTGNMQGVSMPDYTGDERGVPMPGDRGAWDETLYPALHARDLKDSTFIHHMDPENPFPRRLDELDDVDLDGIAGGDGLLYDEGTQTWYPAAVLTPTEHTAIGDGAPHHAAVTLGVDNDADMATLTTQALTVVLKNHDHSGDAGDGGQFALTNLTSGAATNGQVPIADGAGAIAWGAAGASSGEVLMQDGVTAPPIPIETEAQDDWLYEG